MEDDEKAVRQLVKEWSWTHSIARFATIFSIDDLVARILQLLRSKKE